MASQLEIRFQRLIDEEADLSQRGVYEARLACYLARIGEFDRAENIRTDLRKNFGDGRFARISILLMLLDGLLLYYKELSIGARDRIARANLLSSTFRLHDLNALTFAWLAHIDFNQSQFLRMADEIRHCLEFISSDDGEAAVRVSLVLGDAFLYAGKRGASQKWYEKARVAATKLGDQAAIGAITYNRAALNVQRLRLKVLTEAPNEADIAWINTELQTAVNYQSLARLRSLDHLLSAASVNIKVIRKEYEAASEEALELLRSKQAPVNSGEHMLLLSDFARCRAAVGDEIVAKEYLSLIQVSSIDNLDEDDKAIIYDSLSEAAKALGEHAISEKYSNLKKISLNSHVNATSLLGSAIKDFEENQFFDRNL